MTKTLGARDYTPTEIDQHLTTLAFYGGNASRAAEASGIPPSTLKYWRTGPHRDRYLEIAEREAPRLEQLAAHQARETILRAGEAEAELFDVLSEGIQDYRQPPPDPAAFEDPTEFDKALKVWQHRTSSKELAETAGTIQRVTTSKGINGTKLLELTGRPTQVVEHREGTDILRALGAKIPGLVVESTATDTSQQRALPADIGEANARETQSHQCAD